VWIDPTLGAGDASGGVTVSGANLIWVRLALSDYDGNSAAWDEIRWGTTFDSVTAVPEPAAALLGGLGLLGLLRRRRA
jgi:MYXO-CTERM domain-containing protein